MFPLNYVRVQCAESEHPRLTNHEYNFEQFQRNTKYTSIYVKVTVGRMDRQLAVAV